MQRVRPPGGVKWEIRNRTNESVTKKTKLNFKFNFKFNFNSSFNFGFNFGFNSNLNININFDFYYNISFGLNSNLILIITLVLDMYLILDYLYFLLIFKQGCVSIFTFRQKDKNKYL